VNGSSVRDRRWLAALAFAGFAASFLIFAPASVAAWLITRAAPLASIAGTEGTIWKGRLAGVSYGGVPIGDIDYRLHALPLLLARASIDAESAHGALDGAANITVAPGMVEIKNLAAAFNLAAIRRYTFFGVRYQGAAKVTASRLRLTRKGCEADNAAVATSAFDALSRQWSGGSFPMAGAIDCRDGAIVLTLQGEGADGAADLKVTVRPDFSYALTVSARPLRPDLSRALEIFGFENRGDGLSYEAAGVLKGLNS
jgi:hypothetical protein